MGSEREADGYHLHLVMPAPEQTPGYADSCGSSRLHLPGTVDQLSRDRSVGEPSGVSALVVVEAHVGVELALEPAIAQVEVAGKRRSPALLEDRSVEALDVAVGLWASAVDAAVARVERLKRVCERRLCELGAVVGEDALELPARLLELARNTLDQARGLGLAYPAIRAAHQLSPGVA